MFQYLYDDIKSINAEIIPKEEQRNLYMEYQKTKDISIKNKLVLSNLKVVISEVMSFIKKNNLEYSQLDDLIASSYLFCLEKFDLFDPSKGNSSVTSWFKMNTIYHLLNECKNNSLIRLPNSAFNRKREQDKLVNLYYKEKGIHPIAGEEYKGFIFEKFPDVMSGNTTNSNGTEYFKLLEETIEDNDVFYEDDQFSKIGQILYNNKFNLDIFEFFILKNHFIKGQDLKAIYRDLKSNGGSLLKKTKKITLRDKVLNVEIGDIDKIYEYLPYLETDTLKIKSKLLILPYSLFPNESKYFSIYNKKYVFLITKNFSYEDIEETYNTSLLKIKSKMLNNE